MLFYAVNNGIYKHSLVCFSNMSISKKLAVGMVVTVLTSMLTPRLVTTMQKTTLVEMFLLIPVMLM